MLGVKYYLRYSNKKSNNPRNIYMADGRMNCGGMFDRLKGMVSIYALSIAQRKTFGINHVIPFCLEDYLQPNDYDWRCNNIQCSIIHNTPIIAYPGNFSRLVNIRRESHFYSGYDIIDQINEYYNTTFEFGDLYRQLFKPTPHLQAKIDESLAQIGGTKFISIHLRIVNLLGDKTERLKVFGQMKPTEAKSLLNDLRILILNIIYDNPECKIVLATDSNIFRQYIKEQIPSDIMYCVPGKITHIGNSDNVSDEEALKMFVDYYLLSMSEKVYSIVGRGLYSSQFPLYAAIIGNKPFERIKIK